MKEHSLIIGGTSGIGRVLVNMLSDEQHAVSVVAKQSAPEKDLKLKNVQYWIKDINDKRAVFSCIDDITDKVGLINNLFFFQRFRGEGDDWAGEIETTLTATKNIIDYIKNKFAKDGNRSIVVVSSIADTLVAEEQPVSYHVSKAGLKQLVRYYAAVLGPMGIRINSVSPGVILKDEAKDFYNKNSQLLNLYKDIIPLKRMGNSEDVVNAMIYLSSEKAAYITGQNIIIDGGLSLIWQESLSRKLTQNEINIVRKE